MINKRYVTEIGYLSVNHVGEELCGDNVVFVEPDEDTMREADVIVDIGPGAGSHGGDVVAIGTAEEIMKCPESN